MNCNIPLRPIVILMTPNQFPFCGYQLIFLQNKSIQEISWIYKQSLDGKCIPLLCFVWIQQEHKVEEARFSSLCPPSSHRSPRNILHFSSTGWSTRNKFTPIWIIAIIRVWSLKKYPILFCYLLIMGHNSQTLNRDFLPYFFRNSFHTRTRLIINLKKIIYTAI